MRRVKLYKVRNNPFEDYQEDEFKYKYRFTRSTAHLIIEMVKNDLAGDARGGFIPPHLKVLAAIRTWARGEVVSNANLEIMDIVAHWRGSTHDSRIFNECRLKQRFEREEFKGRLLGDSGYACTPYLFTPVLHPATHKEEMYNKAHIHTRNTVERCFGVWKRRFRCLLRGCTTKLENTKLYIVTLAILHNIAMQKQDLVPEAEYNSVPVAHAENNSVRGNAVRAAFINDNF
ncbi:hypothetical protein O3G_MSEX013255 [Manduca sexta]|uniref:DDE Tnp4 domain-containing protein n=1 Tax=Manduca sexta TaxID=7130 RepID=A0A922CXX9_MANSE|nr:hypothetical protein O3G_MSEX013255 [Manduca sexta]